MAAVLAAGTGRELRIRSLLDRRGLRYRPRASAKAITELSGLQCAEPLMPSVEEEHP